MVEIITEGGGISTADMNRRIRAVIRREKAKFVSALGEGAVHSPDPYEVVLQSRTKSARVYMVTVGPASNGERAGALYMEISVGGKVVGRYGGFGKTDGPYADGLKVFTALQEAHAPIPDTSRTPDTSRIDWLGVGQAVHGGDRKRVEAAIAEMDDSWLPYEKGMRLPFSQGYAMRALMQQFKINRIEALNYDGTKIKTPNTGEEDGNWHLMGIQVPYKDGSRRLYFADNGMELYPVCTVPMK